MMVDVRRGFIGAAQETENAGREQHPARTAWG